MHTLNEGPKGHAATAGAPEPYIRVGQAASPPQPCSMHAHRFKTTNQLICMMSLAVIFPGIRAKPYNATSYMHHNTIIPVIKTGSILIAANNMITIINTNTNITITTKGLLLPPGSSPTLTHHESGASSRIDDHVGIRLGSCLG